MGSGFNMALANFVWDKKLSAEEFGNKLLYEIPYTEELKVIRYSRLSNDDSKIEVCFQVKDSNGFPNYYKVLIKRGIIVIYLIFLSMFMMELSTKWLICVTLILTKRVMLNF